MAHTNDFIGVLYGIAIIAFSGKMSEIFAALDAADINYNAAESSEHQVYVDPNHVGRAVEVINALGYDTDEDEVERESIERVHQEYLDNCGEYDEVEEHS